MPVKKSELYSSLWASADNLRGGMDASQYKDYVLALLFVKYVSDKYAGQPDAPIVVPSRGSFADMVALKGKKDIGDGINKIITRLAEANDLKGVINQADFNDAAKLGDGKEMQERLTKLVGIFETSFDFSKNRAEGDDILGDAYEYLMRHFAADSGKSKGQFYTPAEVSRVIAQVIGMQTAKSQDQTLYDPTCGSGSLLLKAADQAPHGISIYGQEKDNATRGLAKMNMILHNQPTAEIEQGNTLTAPRYLNGDGTLKTFDFVVANPPFSDKAWSSGVNTADDPYTRFDGYGVPPLKNGDYAYLLHVIRSLKSAGKGAIILPHGVLFRGNAEANIRKNIINKGYIKGIIGLPANLFYGTGIPACIIVLDKENAAARKGIFMIDASKGFTRDGNKNRLRHMDIHRIVDVLTRQLEIPKYSRLVPLSEISDPKNDYNLNLPRYIDSSDPEDIQDIAAHLCGGIPDADLDALSDYWRVYLNLRAELVASLRPGYSRLKVAPQDLRAAIYSHPEFVAFTQQVDAAFKTWQTTQTPVLKNLDAACKPKILIDALSEDILRTFAPLHLINPYDVYQHLMTYWTETMQDDVYMLASDGWGANPDLIPADLIIRRYFAAEQKGIEALEAARDDIVRKCQEMEEEHGGEEGILDAARNDKDKFTKQSVQKRLKEILLDDTAADEIAVLKSYLSLLEAEASANKAVRDAENALAKKVDAKYKTLTPGEVQVLVVDDKWMAALYSDVKSEMERVSQALTQRLKELSERYAAPLPQLVADVEDLSAKVDAHLQKMGYVWN